MYDVPQFAETRLPVQHALIRGHPLGLIICQDSQGRLSANPLPFIIDPDDSTRGTLLAHMARPNPQWQILDTADECLVVFQGPQAYVTPAWYPSKQQHGKVVPTWNYATVHAWGCPEIIDDPSWIRGQIDRLTTQQEAAQQQAIQQEASRHQPWQVDDAPPDFTASMLQAIVGIRIPISRIEGKWKVSQNRPAEDVAGVAAGFAAAGDAAMAKLVEEAGRG